MDANVPISILIAKGSKHELFFSEHIKVNSPDRVLFDTGKHWKELSEKSKLSEKDLELEFSAIRQQLNIFSFNDLSKWMKEAVEISPDPDDAEYFALALKLNCPIWSEDKLLKRQDKIEVFNTLELIKKLKL